MILLLCSLILLSQLVTPFTHSLQKHQVVECNYNPIYNPFQQPQASSAHPCSFQTSLNSRDDDNQDDKQSDPYTYTSSAGFQVTRPIKPSAKLINDLPRRLFVTTTFLTIPLALGSNFLGVTSNLILSSPVPAVRSLSESLGLNTLYPDASGYKTYISPKPASSLVSSGRLARYKLTLPPSFVQDPSVNLARARATDPNREMRMRGGVGTIPDVAFGPMGKIDPVTRKSSSDVNISVITSAVDKSFNMDRILRGKEPSEAGQVLIDTFLCGPGSGREGKLVEAKLVKRGREMLSIEYVITKPSGKRLRSISLLAPVGGELVTYTVVGREGEFDDDGGRLRRSAESFEILD